METAKLTSKLAYLDCPKGGYHVGEVLNMVCLEKACHQNLSCCCACIEAEHKNHETKPLKMVMSEAHTQSETLVSTNFNIDVILDIINDTKKSTFTLFEKYKAEIINHLNDLEKSLSVFYSSTIEQVAKKAANPKQELQLAFDNIQKPQNLYEFRNAVRKLVSILPGVEGESEFERTEADLIASISNSSDDMNKIVSKTIEEIKKKFNESEESIKGITNNTNIWKGKIYKFSPIFKHGDVKIISETTVKACNNSGYKYAIMEPSLEKGEKIKYFGFKIKESSSNWVAVGACHKEVVKSKSYGFNFGSIGHGGYMISANGGSWSNNKAESNNSVKAFKFMKGDIVSVIFNILTKKMTFKKKKEIYELDFDTINGDELYPCVLFYYINDEIEFLANYKE